MFLSILLLSIFAIIFAVCAHGQCMTEICRLKLETIKVIYTFYKCIYWYHIYEWTIMVNLIKKYTIPINIFQITMQCIICKLLPLWIMQLTILCVSYQ
jgi:hypothetical protein